MCTKTRFYQEESAHWKTRTHSTTLYGKFMENDQTFASKPSRKLRHIASHTSCTYVVHPQTHARFMGVNIIAVNHKKRSSTISASIYEPPLPQRVTCARKHGGDRPEYPPAFLAQMGYFRLDMKYRKYTLKTNNIHEL